MAAWNPVHWHEGMFLLPHHLQAERRWDAATLDATLRAARSFAWGVLELSFSREALENFTLRLDECLFRLKDGTWTKIPDNTTVDPLNFKDALESGGGVVDILFGIPQWEEVRPNSLSLTNPEQLQGNPRYEPFPSFVRDENTGEQRQRIYLRRYRGKLFTGDQDTAGYEVIRIGTIRRSDRPGAAPEFDDNQVGPLLSLQASPAQSRLFTTLADQVEAKNELLASEARQMRMSLADGSPAYLDHLFKLQLLNAARARLRAVAAAPLLHPFDVYLLLSGILGEFSIFDDTSYRPDALPPYDHDRPGVALKALQERIVALLHALRPERFDVVPFARRTDTEGQEGVTAELRMQWVTEEREFYIALESTEFEARELLEQVYARFDLKIASPTRAPRLRGLAVKGLRLRDTSVTPFGLPSQRGLHYFRIEKGTGPEAAYWQECLTERGIWISINQGQIADFESLRPALYVPRPRTA
jgi:type VI secretion system protein ImpJ